MRTTLDSVDASVDCTNDDKFSISLGVFILPFMVTNETEEFCACGVTKVSIHFSGSAREIPLFFIIISISSSVSLSTRRLSTFSFLDDVLLTDAVAKME